jgi:hypothetical protein
VHTATGRSTAALGEVATAKTIDAAWWFTTLSDAVVVSEATEALVPKGQFIFRRDLLGNGRRCFLQGVSYGAGPRGVVKAT